MLNDLLPVLQFIHAHHVIHRDIKPENIIRRSSLPPLGKEGWRDLVLIDFGVAKYLTATAIAQPGTSIGSFGYASLEQMNSGEVYSASDLYSLGVTCFHLLTRIHPSKLWAEQGYSWVMDWQQHLNTPISQKLAQVLDKLLQKDLHLRYQFADEVLQDLDAQAQSPILAPIAVTQPPESGIIGANPRSPLPFEQQRLQPQYQKRYPAFAPANLLRRLLVGSGILGLGVSGYVYWHLGRISTLTGHNGEVNAIAFSPDGKKIASGSDDRTIKIWSLNSRRKLRTLKGHSDWVYTVAISPNGRTLSSGSKDNKIKVWNLNTGQQLLSLSGHSSYINSVAISPDGQKIASGSYDKTIKIWNLNTGQELRTLKGHATEVLSVAISPDIQKIASGSTDKTIKIWNLNTGQELRTLKGHTGDVNSIAFSPNGQELASVSDDKTIKIWNPNTGREIRTLMGHLADVNFVAFSPDGQKIAAGSDDKTIKVWNLITGEEVATLRGHSAPVWSVAFSPNGQTLVSGSADRTIKIWQVPK
jgi:serine/threonine protein kinase